MTSIMSWPGAWWVVIIVSMLCVTTVLIVSMLTGNLENL